MTDLKNDEDFRSGRECKICLETVGVWKCDQDHYFCNDCKMKCATYGKIACTVPNCTCLSLYPTADNPFTYLGLNVDISTLPNRAGATLGCKGVLRIKTRLQSSCGIIRDKIAETLKLEAAALGLFKDGIILKDSQLLHEAAIVDNMSGISCEYSKRLLLELDATTIRTALKPTLTLSARLSSKLAAIKKEICNRLGINENQLSIKLVGSGTTALDLKYLMEDMLLLDAGLHNFSKLELEINSLMPGQFRVNGVGISVMDSHPLVQGSKDSIVIKNLGVNEPVTVEKVIGPYALISEPVKGWIFLYNSESSQSITRIDQGFYAKGEEVFGFYRRGADPVGKWYLASIQGWSEDQSTYLIRWNSSKLYSNIPAYSMRKDTRRKVRLDLSDWGTVQSKALAPGVQGPVRPPTQSKHSKSTLAHTRASMQVPLNWTVQRIGKVVGQQILANYNIIRFRLPGESSELPEETKISSLKMPITLKVVEVSSVGQKKTVKGYKRMNFKLHERIEAKSHRDKSFGKWFSATVVKVKKTQIKIHWLEFDEKEWITAPKWSAMLRKPEKKRQYKVGDKVKVKRTAGNWKPATIYENLGDDSYHVRFNDEQEVNIWPHPVEDIKMEKVGIKRRSSL